MTDKNEVRELAKRIQEGTFCMGYYEIVSTPEKWLEEAAEIIDRQLTALTQERDALRRQNGKLMRHLEELLPVLESSLQLARAAAVEA